MKYDTVIMIPASASTISVVAFVIDCQFILKPIVSKLLNNTNSMHTNRMCLCNPKLSATY